MEQHQCRSKTKIKNLKFELISYKVCENIDFVCITLSMPFQCFKQCAAGRSHIKIYMKRYEFIKKKSRQRKINIYIKNI